MRRREIYLKQLRDRGGDIQNCDSSLGCTGGDLGTDGDEEGV